MDYIFKNSDFVCLCVRVVFDFTYLVYFFKSFESTAGLNISSSTHTRYTKDFNLGSFIATQSELHEGMQNSPRFQE